MATDLLETTEHRPWPVPGRAFVMHQTWSALLFAHWPVQPGLLRDLVPPALEIETRGGNAWIGIVPFRMSNVRLRGLPAVPGTSAFPELNVRTYVRHGDRPGVWFFSLDAASRLAVRVARAWFRLPYFDATMSCERAAKGSVAYKSHRTHHGAHEAEFHATYGPAGDVARAEPGTLEHWLTERYCLYTLGPRGKDGVHTLRRGDIHHAPWPLAPAWAEIRTNTLTDGLELPLHGAPLLHYADSIDVVCWAPERVGSTAGADHPTN